MGQRHGLKLLKGLISSWSHTPLLTLQVGLQVGLSFCIYAVAHLK